jgi:uncharacterized membrane protein
MQARTDDNEMSATEPENRWVLTFMLVAALLIVLLIGLFFSDKSTSSEVQMALVIVIAIAALLTLLFIVAGAFANLKLTDRRQPLGLPEGSVRSLIALMLIMVFIIFGVYLFRIVGAGIATGPFAMSADQLAKLDQKNVAAIVDLGNGTSNVWLRMDLSADGARIAQQLITTVGTLVVAVAGFYFGSSTVSSAMSSARNNPPTNPGSNRGDGGQDQGDNSGGDTARPSTNGGSRPVTPRITDINPPNGDHNADALLTIIGENLQMVERVRLVRGAEELVATDVVARNATTVTCTVKLDKPAGGGAWDVIVENKGGEKATHENAFTIM